jgi:hypothetical protein
MGTMAQVNLLTLCWYWGAAKSRRGSKQHATYVILLESSSVNTGDLLRDGKGSGE